MKAFFPLPIRSAAEDRFSRHVWVAALAGADEPHTVAEVHDLYFGYAAAGGADGLLHTEQDVDAAVLAVGGEVDVVEDPSCLQEVIRGAGPHLRNSPDLVKVHISTCFAFHGDAPCSR